MESQERSVKLDKTEGRDGYNRKMPLDIGLGIVSAIAVSYAASVPLDSRMIVLGAIFALLPDLDFLIYLLRRKANEFSHEHRNLLHNPLLYIPVGFGIFSFAGIATASLFGLCALFHFLHDSTGIGWGIRWLYPFSRNYFKFSKDARSGIVSWTPEEQREMAARFGNPHWLSDYLKFSSGFLKEMAVLGAAIALLFWILLGR